MLVALCERDAGLKNAGRNVGLLVALCEGEDMLMATLSLNADDDMVVGGNKS